MSISNLIVAVRTTGAAQLTRLGAGFRGLHHQVQSATSGMRLMGAQGSVAVQSLRARLDATNNSIAAMSSRLHAVQGNMGGLRTAASDAAAEVARLDRLVRFMGQGASNDLRNRLALAQIAAMRARGAFADAHMEALRLAQGLHNARTHAGQLGAALTHVERLQAIGMSITRGLTNAVDAFGSAAGSAASSIAPLAAIIAAIIVFAVPLTAALVSLTGAVQLLVPAVIGAIAAFAALKLGLTGVGEAISAGLSGDMEKFHKALKKLAPSAREFATSAVQIGKSWRSVQRATQQSLFAGGNLPHWLRRLAIDFKPIAATWLPAIADGFSKAGRELSMFLIDPGTKSQIVGILANVKRFLDGILASITPLTQAFLDIGEVAAPLFGDMGERAGTLAEKFAAFIREAKESGKLAAWLNSAKEALKTLGQISGDVKDMLAAIWTGGKEGGQGLLDKVHELTAAFAAWLQTDEGQEMIDFMGFLAQAALGLVGIAVVLSQAWIGMTKAMELAFKVLVEAFLTGVGVIINAAARAWGWIPGIGPKLQQAAAEFNAFRDSVNKALDGIDDEQVVVSVMTRTDGASSAVSNALSNGVSRSNIRFRAAGGPVSAGRSYIVGERGPELVTMGGNGYVTNARDTASMMSGGATQVQLVAGAGGDGLIAGVINKLVRTGQLKLKVVGSRVVPA